MKRQSQILRAALTGVMMLAAPHLHAAQPTARSSAGGADEINLTADKLSTAEGSNQIEASGNVEI
ncbi:MAG: hypothetical protein ACREPG_01250, partial [Candidatus Binatia bacterium]